MVAQTHKNLTLGPVSQSPRDQTQKSPSASAAFSKSFQNTRTTTQPSARQRLVQNYVQGGRPATAAPQPPSLLSPNNRVTDYSPDRYSSTANWRPPTSTSRQGHNSVQHALKQMVKDDMSRSPKHGLTRQSNQPMGMQVKTAAPFRSIDHQNLNNTIAMKTLDTITIDDDFFHNNVKARGDHNESTMQQPIIAGPSSGITIDQRQRIFEDVIVQRLKVMQEFVKRHFVRQKGAENTEKLNQSTKPQPANINEKLGELLGRNQGQVEAIIDEAVKWKIEAFQLKQSDRIGELENSFKSLSHSMQVVTEECNSQFQSTNKTVLGLGNEVQEKLIVEMQRQISRAQKDTTETLKQDLLELEDRIDLLESQGGETQQQHFQMMEELDKYQDNIDKVIQQVEEKQKQISFDLTDNVQNIVDGHSAQMSRIEKDIEKKNQEIQKQVSKTQNDLTLFINKLDQQPSLNQGDVEEIVNAAQVTLFDKQLEMEQKFKQATAKIQESFDEVQSEVEVYKTSASTFEQASQETITNINIKLDLLDTKSDERQKNALDKIQELEAETIRNLQSEIQSLYLKLDNEVFTRTMPKAPRSPTKQFEKSPVKQEEPVIKKAVVSFEEPLIRQANVNVVNVDQNNSISVEELDDLFVEFNKKVETKPINNIVIDEPEAVDQHQSSEDSIDELDAIPSLKMDSVEAKEEVESIEMVECHSPQIFTKPENRNIDTNDFSMSKLKNTDNLRKATVDFQQVIQSNKLGNEWDHEEPALYNIEQTIDEFLERELESLVEECKAEIMPIKTKPQQKKRYQISEYGEEQDNSFDRDDMEGSDGDGNNWDESF